MNNDLVINATESEIVIALLQDRQLVEIHKEKRNKHFSVGDIYLGKVKKIMPGLNAAFVDVGYEKDAFLHYQDLGPMFSTMHKYVHTAIDNPKNCKPLQTINLLPEIDKKGKITEQLQSGQRILVQISKEPISTKGPRLTSEISIAGRNLVLLPFSDKVSISQKIKSKEERERLRQLIMAIKPKNYGIIVRTEAKSRRVSVLDEEIQSLVERWETAVSVLAKNGVPPKLIVGEMDATSAILRDTLNNNFNSIVVNDVAIYHETKKFIGSIAPEKEKIVKLDTDNISLFDRYFNIEKQIKLLFGKTVTFKNGAYLIMEHTEALFVIDVNSGNRANNIDQESNALDVNLAAADEIARQLRLRDIGGIIVVDFIDMHLNQNKKALFDKMKEAMATDRTKHNILPLSKFGLMQITRQRVRPEMNMNTQETCPTCGGTGEINSSILLVDEIEENLKNILAENDNRRLVLRVNPIIAAYITKGFISVRFKWELKYKVLIKIQSDSEYGLIKFDFFDTEGNLLSF
ncbi:MAG: Rne/Rng family ribonuclease [Bacteroidales bacterium]|nr:Rne/Rng family ribonuclease [Bacteroidales bacterium]